VYGVLLRARNIFRNVPISSWTTASPAKKLESI